MVLSEGIEPSFAACKTTALPIGELSIMVDLNGFKPFLLECKSSVLSLTLKAVFTVMIKYDHLLRNVVQSD